MKTERWRLQMAEAIVRCVDTVTLLRCDEVEDIRRRALAGEFDNDLMPELCR